jgi:general nucleoside transport system ATP-binding protein
VMFQGRLSAPLRAAEVTREKLGLLMGGAKAGDGPSVEEASHAVGA